MSTQDVPMAGLGDIMDNDAPLFGVPVRRAKVTPPDLSPYTVSSIRATVRQYRAHCRWSRTLRSW
jgi:hypothetical protein